MTRILLLSQDPTIRGGGTRVASVTKEMLRAVGHECVEAFVATMSHPRLSLTGVAGPLRWIDADGDRRALLAVLPELQAPPLLSGRLAVRRLGRVETWDHVLIAGASVYHGITAGGLGLPTSVWGATTVGEERRNQWDSLGVARGVVRRAAHPVLERCERLVLRRADRVAGMSPYACESLERVVRRPVGLLYPPVPLPEHHDPSDRARALTSLMRPRTVEFSVTAMPDDLRPFSVPDGVRLHCLGYPGDAELRATVSEAHWLLLGSRQEGFGFAAAEALACGTPVASTRCGGPESMLTESGGGFLADLADMAARVSAVSAGEWTEMSNLARAYAEKTFSMEVALPAFESLLGRR
jgi:hypothetical protein